MLLERLIDAKAVDYLILVVYFAFVLGVGWLAKRQVGDAADYFQSGRSLPAWGTGLAFASANLRTRRVGHDSGRHPKGGGHWLRQAQPMCGAQPATSCRASRGHAPRRAPGSR